MVGERRFFVRFAMSGDVVVQTDPSKGGSIDGELIDLSLDGVGLYSAKTLAIESKVKFLVINRQLNINLGGIGRVVYCQKVSADHEYYRVGLEFVEVDRVQVKAILMQVRRISVIKGVK
ncbi:MAG TPA: PilZ domain-containing protein [Candidatus Omnitrophota bacterium]|nr:PilZ domain-containing protein [Candidatus Omnitrophota bacterium]HQO37572.1 PilZ domain-containing protein [Candidatus Omnitrophota bacterium]HQQ05492.1 PilZ domain-containing protein [Candidatus Omnitrophota bacterium]